MLNSALIEVLPCCASSAYLPLPGSALLLTGAGEEVLAYICTCAEGLQVHNGD